MKNDSLVFFNEFHYNGKLVRGSNSTFLTLIPKVDGASTLSEFRPISMVGCIYKLLSKVLANRFKLVLPSIIGEAQADFISGKQILDGILIANEVIHQWKHSNSGGLIIKIDFEKAFDCVN